MKLCLGASLGLMAGWTEEAQVSAQVDSPTFESMSATSLELGALLDAESLTVCQAWSAWETGSHDPAYL